MVRCSAAVPTILQVCKASYQAGNAAHRWKTGCSKLGGQAAQLQTVHQGSQPQLRRIPQAPCNKQLLASHRWHKQVHFYAHTMAFLCDATISSFSARVSLDAHSTSIWNVQGHHTVLWCLRPTMVGQRHCPVRAPPTQQSWP